jgi:HK97 family phage prohead protease
MSGGSEYVTRFVPLQRAKVDIEDERRLTGYAIVFNSLSQDLGGFKERIAPVAVDRTLRTSANVDALIDHRRETTTILGSTDSGLLKLRKDRHGLAVDVRPPDTSMVRDLLTVVKAGLVKGMSFAFRVFPDGQEWEEEDGILVRTVTDMEFSEVSFVVNPAYLDTEASARNHKIDAETLAAFKASTGWKPSIRMRERMIRAGSR